ncbi:MAG: WhiB family transcriptional regulator [Acidimicrobiales bacterium]|jgi:WhiB family redox-sensing transcriptional regulator|nr:WhiB family transcriptional regulator [Acidimicrobiales bacterium]HCV36115.1 WhiB family transcriptional regulator [Acidimicrobiaceae bacterium]HJO80455.1 WhiB family transcriptional regulator [Acidimicrobiales bacterium]
MAGELSCRQWEASAACRGPQAGEFFPPECGEGRDEKQRREVRAKAVCSQCLVLSSCLDYAVRIREVHGIWGGTNERERRALLGLSV